MLADKLRYTIDTSVDLFELMGTNSYFNSRYPRGFVPTPPDLSALPVVYEDEFARILWNGFADTHTSGMDFQPALYLENKGTEVLSVSPSDFYVNDCLMSVSNSGAVTLEGGAKLILSTRNSWLLSAGDLLDAYESDTIERFSVRLKITYGQKTLFEDRFTIDTHVDLYELMGENSYFTKKYGTREE